jgi:hypothetical protein
VRKWLECVENTFLIFFIFCFFLFLKNILEIGVKINNKFDMKDLRVANVIPKIKITRTIDGLDL